MAVAILGSLPPVLKAVADSLRQMAGAQTDPATAFLMRVEPLRPALSGSGEVGYLRDAARIGPEPHPVARPRLIAYSMAPLRVRESQDLPLVIFDSDEAAAEPAAAAHAGWRLILDLRDGIKLYRTRAGE